MMRNPQSDATAPVQRTLESSSPRLDTRPLRILAAPAFSQAKINPYQALLYHEMLAAGHQVLEFPVGPFDPFSLGQQDLIHLHWHDVYLGASGQKIVFVKTLLSNIVFFTKQKLGGVKVVWTVHDASTLMQLHWLVRCMYKAFLRITVDAWIALSASSQREAIVLNPWLERLPRKVILHGHYRGAYPDTISRAEARKRLGLEPGDTVILWFGRIRPYKGLPELVRAFRAIQAPSYRLLIAGPDDGTLTEDLLVEIRRDSRISIHIRFIEEAETATFFRGSDLCALPYRRIFNSGSVILSLSFSVPVLVTESPAIKDLEGIVGPGWIATHTGTITPEAIEHAVEHFASRPSPRVAPPLDELEWPALSAQTLEFFQRLVAGTHG